MRQLPLLRSKNQVELQQHGPLLVTERVAQNTYHAKVACRERMDRKGEREGQGLYVTKLLQTLGSMQQLLVDGDVFC